MMTAGSNSETGREKHDAKLLSQTAKQVELDVVDIRAAGADSIPLKKKREKRYPRLSPEKLSCAGARGSGA
jgi:hypothetical protein